jgi:hypothetical protein
MPFSIKRFPFIFYFFKTMKFCAAVYECSRCSSERFAFNRFFLWSMRIFFSFNNMCASNDKFFVFFLFKFELKSNFVLWNMRV